MMTDSDWIYYNKKRLADDLGVSLQKVEASYRALCQRLEIWDGLPEALKWPSVARFLFGQQPEFQFERPSRGRKKLGRGKGIDYRRALAVDALRQAKRASGEKRRITDQALVEELREHGHKLFTPKKSAKSEIDLRTLVESVSRGNHELKQRRAAFAQLRQQADAKEWEREAEFKRQQARVQRKQRRHDATTRKKIALGGGGPLALAIYEDQRKSAKKAK